MSRRDDALRLAELVGREGLVIDDPADGWPALGRVVGLDDPIEVALYVAPVGFSHRNRDDVERRFQNPGSDRPIELVPGALPVFIGIWEGDDPDIREVPAVLVTADPFRRVGRTTRFSVFPKVESLRIARATGIHVGETTTGEEIAAFAPALLRHRSMPRRRESPPTKLAIDTSSSPPRLIRRLKGSGGSQAPSREPTASPVQFAMPTRSVVRCAASAST